MPPRSAVVAVLVGGAVGTALRDLAVHVHTSGSFPWVTLALNVVGAFALGLVLPGLLARAHPLAGRFVGTGVIAAFTTMSTFAVETALLVRDGDTALAASYVAATLVVGLTATAVAMQLGRRWETS